jgi:hypothetical protein
VAAEDSGLFGHIIPLFRASVTPAARRDPAFLISDIFIAGPDAFAFFLGQHHVALGPTAVYEWDFEGRRGGSYSWGFRT